MWQHLYTEQHVSTSAWLTYSREEEVNAYLQGQMCCVDERDRVQKKTFTKWVNKHLMKAQQSVDDLYEDLRDGHNLISLLEVLSGDSLVSSLEIWGPVSNHSCFSPCNAVGREPSTRGTHCQSLRVRTSAFQSCNTRHRDGVRCLLDV
uniref:Calponin-homology (CH) domain-containing protein n=1 Tax=Callorhinchus milii TaxID=7868 RepID=A0A4W3GHF1_CALMI